VRARHHRRLDQRLTLSHRPGRPIAPGKPRCLATRDPGEHSGKRSSVPTPHHTHARKPGGFETRQNGNTRSAHALTLSDLDPANKHPKGAHARRGAGRAEKALLPQGFLTIGAPRFELGTLVPQTDAAVTTPDDGRPRMPALKRDLATQQHAALRLDHVAQVIQPR
jgi:hypothetical protein